jgi:predicted LPLAT superfamily acyltransferase
MKIGGLNRACEVVWFVCLYYVMFDRGARRAGMPYIRRRFPDAGPLRRLWYLYRLFVSQGQSLLEGVYLRRGGAFECRFENSEYMDDMLRSDGRGLVLLTSHFGCWQGMMSELGNYRRRVNLLVTPELNEYVRVSLGLGSDRSEVVNVISNQDATGGMVDIVAALDRGELVCLMGDRLLEGAGVPVEFLGGSALFPVAAFHVASIASCPVIPMFMVRDRGHRRFLIHYAEPIWPTRAGNRRRVEILRECAQVYAGELEGMSRRYAFQCYVFDDVWAKGTRRIA